MITYPPLQLLAHRFADCAYQSHDLLCKIRCGLQEMEGICIGSEEETEGVLRKVQQSAERVEEVRAVMEDVAGQLRRLQQMYDELEYSAARLPGDAQR